MISWGVGVFFSVDFLLTSELVLGLGLESKSRSCLEWNKGLGCSDELVSYQQQKNNSNFSPRTYLEIKGNEATFIKVLVCLASLSELSVQPHNELRAELQDSEDKTLLWQHYKEGICVQIK